MFISVICVALSMEDSDNFDISRREVLLRGSDMNYFYSRATVRQGCFPVEKTAENKYRISLRIILLSTGLPGEYYPAFIGQDRSQAIMLSTF